MIGQKQWRAITFIDWLAAIETIDSIAVNDNIAAKEISYCPIERLHDCDGLSAIDGLAQQHKTI